MATPATRITDSQRGVSTLRVRAVRLREVARIAAIQGGLPRFGRAVLEPTIDVRMQAVLSLVYRAATPEISRDAYLDDVASFAEEVGGAAGPWLSRALTAQRGVVDTLERAAFAPGALPRLHAAARRYFERLNDPAARSVAEEIVRSGGGRGSPLLAAQAEREREARARAVIQGVGDELFRVLFAHPRRRSLFVEIAAGETEARAALTAAFGEARQGIAEFGAEVAAAPDHLWRYPPIVVAALGQLGLTGDEHLARYALAYATARSGSPWETALSVAGLALLAASLVFLAGPAALVVLAADGILSGYTAYEGYLRARENGMAEAAGAFEGGRVFTDEATSYGPAALMAAAALLNGLLLVRGTIKAVREARGAAGAVDEVDEIAEIAQAGRVREGRAEVTEGAERAGRVREEPRPVGERGTERPVERPVEHSADRPGESQASRADRAEEGAASRERPGESPASTADRPAEGQASRTEQPAERPASTAERSGEGQASRAEQPGDGPASRGRPGEGQASRTDQPGESPASTGERPGESPASAADRPAEGQASRTDRPGESPASATERPPTERPGAADRLEPGDRALDRGAAPGGRRTPASPLPRVAPALRAKGLGTSELLAIQEFARRYPQLGLVAHLLRAPAARVARFRPLIPHLGAPGANEVVHAFFFGSRNQRAGAEGIAAYIERRLAGARITRFEVPVGKRITVRRSGPTAGRRVGEVPARRVDLAVEAPGGERWDEVKSWSLEILQRPGSRDELAWLLVRDASANPGRHRLAFNLTPDLAPGLHAPREADVLAVLDQVVREDRAVQVVLGIPDAALTDAARMEAELRRFVEFF